MTNPSNNQTTIIVVAIVCLAVTLTAYSIYSTYKSIKRDFTEALTTLDEWSQILITKEDTWRAKFAPILADSTKVGYAEALDSIFLSTKGLIRQIDSLKPVFDGITTKDSVLVNEVMLKQGYAERLKNAIATAEHRLKNLSIWNAEDRVMLDKSLTITTQFDEKNAKKLGRPTWEEYHFEDVPPIAVITLLNKFRNDAEGSREFVLEWLYAKATEVEVTQQQ